jgi:hypothetical protein
MGSFPNKQGSMPADFSVLPSSAFRLHLLLINPVSPRSLATKGLRLSSTSNIPDMILLRSNAKKWILTY